jgi:hypothetical protein
MYELAGLPCVTRLVMRKIAEEDPLHSRLLYSSQLRVSLEAKPWPGGHVAHRLDLPRSTRPLLRLHHGAWGPGARPLRI